MSWAGVRRGDAAWEPAGKAVFLSRYIPREGGGGKLGS